LTKAIFQRLGYPGISVNYLNGKKAENKYQKDQPDYNRKTENPDVCDLILG
jgi:hypothetical protein